MKKVISLFLCAILVIGCFAGCSKTSNELTEENVNATVDIVWQALKEFDTETLGKFVESPTLSTIVNYAEGHDQFVDLGKALFENLTVEVKSVDLESKTVTVSVKNKDLYYAANNFANDLKNNYSSFQLLSKLTDDDFLDNKLAALCSEINAAEMQPSAAEINLYISQGKNNLVLKFDSTAENAVSGGALDAIKSIYGG
ncbi:MAG: hypothetical protein ACI4IK_05490 [Eubacterium sp.]